MLFKMCAQIRNFDYHVDCNLYLKFKLGLNDNKNFKYCFTFKPKFSAALNVVGVHVTFATYCWVRHTGKSHEHLQHLELH